MNNLQRINVRRLMLQINKDLKKLHEGFIGDVDMNDPIIIKQYEGMIKEYMEYVGSRINGNN